MNATTGRMRADAWFAVGLGSQMHISAGSVLSKRRTEMDVRKSLTLAVQKQIYSTNEKNTASRRGDVFRKHSVIFFPICVVYFKYMIRGLNELYFRSRIIQCYTCKNKAAEIVDYCAQWRSMTFEKNSKLPQWSWPRTMSLFVNVYFEYCWGIQLADSPDLCSVFVVACKLLWT